MDLRISTTNAQIGIHYSQTQMEINTRLKDMEIQVSPLEMHIDLSQPLAEIGYKKILPMEAEYATAGRETVLAGVQRVAVEGDSLARSAGNGVEIIGQIAWNNTIDNREFNIDFIPRTPPRVWFTGGGMRVNVESGLPDIHITPGVVEVYLEQKPEIRIEAVGSYLDLVI